MCLSDRLAIPRGVTAVVGGGGKTSLIWRLAQELSLRATVLIATTAHIRPPACITLREPDRAAIRAAFLRHRLLAIGDPAPEGKLAQASRLRGDYRGLADYVLIEADGSRGLPLKAPGAHEPAMPGDPSLTIAVAGMSCLGRTVVQAAHRPALYAALAGLGEQDPVTPEAVAKVLADPAGQRKGVAGRFLIVLNQADTEERLAFARQIASRLAEETWITALASRPDWAERGTPGLPAGGNA